MIWRNEELKNPLSGKDLKRDSPHSFSDGEQRFPVVEAIPFLRANRDDLCREALMKLDAGDERGATILLLQDRDDWASGEPPTMEDLQPLFENKHLTLRDAMRHLKYGAVADYFAYRWSDPTFLSGLCLLENHLPPDAKKVFELCCGIGHYLREFDLRDIEATGADVVFSKLWLARKFVAPRAKLVCLDANFDFPFADKTFDASFCHDAFYFLPQKAHVADELKRTTRDAILIGHAHNSDAENFSSGAAISTAEYAALFENSVLYDDGELTKAFVENRTPNAQTVEELKQIEAVCLAPIIESKISSESTRNSFLESVTTENLSVNPLLLNKSGEIQTTPIFPSERYENEYAPLSAYLNLSNEEAEILEGANRESKFDSANETILRNFARRRILLDLPENW